MDLDDPNLATVIPFITNAEAIAVNQNWAGSPGMLLQSNHVPARAAAAPFGAVRDPPPPHHTAMDSKGFVIYQGQLNKVDDGGKPLRVANMSSADAETWCNQTAACTCFTAMTTTDGEPTSHEPQVINANAAYLCVWHQSPVAKE